MVIIDITADILIKIPAQHHQLGEVISVQDVNQTLQN